MCVVDRPAGFFRDHSKVCKLEIGSGLSQEVHMAILTQGPRLCVVVIRYLHKGITSPDASFGHWLIKSSLPFTS